MKVEQSQLLAAGIPRSLLKATIADLPEEVKEFYSKWRKGWDKRGMPSTLFCVNAPVTGIRLASIVAKVAIVTGDCAKMVTEAALLDLLYENDMEAYDTCPSLVVYDLCGRAGKRKMVESFVDFLSERVMNERRTTLVTTLSKHAKEMTASYTQSIEIVIDQMAVLEETRC